MQKLPRLFQLIISITFVSLIILSLFRLGFWAYFNDSHDPINNNDLLKAFYIGLKFDLRLSLLLLLPLLLLGGLRWFSPFSTRLNRLLWTGYLVVAFLTILFFYILHFANFAYLHKPLDATILRFLENLTISMQMVWQTYPVIWLSLLLLMVAGGSAYLVNRRIGNLVQQTPHVYPRLKKIAIGSLGTFLVLFGMYGKFSYYPLRWSDAFTSQHQFAPPVTINPVLHFVETLKNKDSGFDIKTATRYYDLMSDFLQVTSPDKQRLNYQRVINTSGELHDKRPNIVVVYLESFASYKTGTFGNPLNPTPHFDAIAKDSILFTRYYSPTPGTARSVFTGLTGLPDIEKVKTSSRNPLIVDQKMLINNFKDYDKYYFLGGSANWGNIRGLLSRNIHGLKIYEEGSYQAERVDVWGISDVSLFEEANKVLKKQDKPFVAIIQTSGNHRPYTIPEDHSGFEVREEDKKVLNRSGFISNKEFNSFRYLDHSIGHFMKLAKKEAYFDNTIFVFFGDHGIAGYGGAHTPAFESQLQLTNLHVPLVFYAPKLLKPRTLDFIASEVDVFPTLAALASGPHTLTTIGRNLLDDSTRDKHYALTLLQSGQVQTIGLLGPRFYLQVQTNGKNLVLHDTQAKDARVNVSAQYPDAVQRMLPLAQGIYETTRYIRYNNKQQR